MSAQNTADSGHFILALLLEESLGSKCLTSLGVSIDRIADGCFGESVAMTASTLSEIDDFSAGILSFPSGVVDKSDGEPPTWCRATLERARFVARRDNGELSSEHLLLAMVDVDGPLKRLLAEFGVTHETVTMELNDDSEPEQTLEIDFELHIENGDSNEEPPGVSKRRPETILNVPDQSTRLLALIDANLNRAREGLRVLEDYSRFIRRELATTIELKALRHDLVDAELALRRTTSSLLENRNTDADVGTDVTTTSEMRRDNLDDVVKANARRVQEALRSLEEFGKVIDPEFAAQIKQLRYRCYFAEQLIAAEQTTAVSERRLQQLEYLNRARLYVLITEDQCHRPWKEVVLSALAGGADVIQLREKFLDDDEIVRRARWLAEVCETADALFILNDRIDLAVAAGAHGVHLGQDDVSHTEARSLLCDDQLLGVSTHDAQQVVEACSSGADYLGVGPVFASQTKDFQDFPGLEFVSKASQKASRPWFAIGGIGLDNVDEVVEAGATRIAVCSAVIAQPNPEKAAGALVRRLTCGDTDECSTVKFPP